MTKATKKTPVFDCVRLERRVASYLGRFLTSEARLRNYIARLLRRWQERGEVRVSEGDIAGIVDQAVRKGYVDDRRFAESFVARGHQSGLPVQAIRQRLAGERIAPELVARAVEAFRANQETHVAWADGTQNPDWGLDRVAAMHYARRRGIGPFRGCEREQWYKRDLSKLARRGFSREIAIWVLSQGEQGNHRH